MKFLKVLLFFLIIFFSFCAQTFAEVQLAPINQTYQKAKVLKIFSESTKNVEGVKNVSQKIQVEILDGVDKDKKITFESGKDTTLTSAQIVTQGEAIILTKIKTPDNKVQYQVYDSYRVSRITYIFLIFLLVVILLAGWKGLGSVGGLMVSLVIIFLYIVPQILNGSDPLAISIYGSIAILILTTYMAHGISKQTTVALLATFVALMLTSWISSLFVNITHLAGFTEETSSLQFGATSKINLKGLLLGGIIIGTLGALNDVTTTQSAAVFEISKTDSKLSFGNLFKKGFSIGREHVVSMVNTLVLAYAGSSLALFLFLILNPLKLPLWVMINSEDISDEIIRTISGSLGLVLVVPIVTFLAVIFCNAEVKRAFKQILHSLK